MHHVIASGDIIADFRSLTGACSGVVLRGLKRRASTGLAMRPPPAMRELAVTPEPSPLLPAPQSLPAVSSPPDAAHFTDADGLGSLTASKVGGLSTM